MSVAGTPSGPPMPTGQCAVCGDESRLSCQGCKFLKPRYYCSKEHQLQDWKKHRSECKFYKIVKEPGKRTYLVATRKIEKDTIILKAKPAVIVPSGSKPFCLGCLKHLIWDVMTYLCAGCGWPVCNPECEQAPMHQLECMVMRNAGFRFDTNYLKNEWQPPLHSHLTVYISVLRLLLSSRLTELLKLQRQKNYKIHHPLLDASSKILSIEVIKFIKDTLKLQQFGADIISTTLELLYDCNLPVKRIQDSHQSFFEEIHGCGVYASDVAFIEHSCFPNLMIIEKVEEPSIANLVAKTDILPGDKLCAFTHVLCSLKMSTLERQEIRQNSFQNCECQRCMDPSELQLHYGSLFCSKCRGMVTPIDMKNVFKSNWRCNKCLSITIAKKVKEKVMHLVKMLTCAMNHKDNLSHLGEFVNSHSGPNGALHAKHSLIYTAKEAYCTSIFNASTEKGAAYDYDPCVLDNFFIYSQDLCSRNTDLKERLGWESLRERLVFSRRIIHQWAKKTVTKKEAQVQIADIFKQISVLRSNTRNIDVILNNQFKHVESQLLTDLQRLVNQV